jgi:hypothetical protein
MGDHRQQGGPEGVRDDSRGGAAAGNDGLGGTDAGSPGGMGGSGVSGATGTGRPPGGVSPVQAEEEASRQGEDDQG